MLKTPWQILEMEPSSDKKLIKRQYAEKLKQTRPDEEAEKFQQLHLSYKQALHLAQQMSNQNDVDAIDSPTTSDDIGMPSQEQPEAPELNTQSQDISGDIQQPSAPQSSTRDEVNRTEQQQAQFDEARQQLIAQFKAVLADNTNRNRPQAYDFLEQCPHIVDMAFRSQLSYAVFEVLVNYEANLRRNSKSLFGGKAVKVRRDEIIWPGILAKLDQLLDFGSKIERFFYRYPPEICASLFARIEQVDVDKVDVNAINSLKGGQSHSVGHTTSHPAATLELFQLSNSVRRLGAYIADSLISLIVVLILVFVVQKAGFDTSQDGIMILLAIMYFPLYFAYFVLMEYRMGGTLGKLLMGMQVVGDTGYALTWRQAVSRTLVFMLFSTGGYLTLFINGVIGPKFIHDRLSKTWVIDRWREI